MSTPTLAVPNPCPHSTDASPHTRPSGDSADLISHGPPDHGVSVYLGRCRYCVVPLLVVVGVSEDLCGGGPFLEAHGAQL